jgi:hypothetical protein
MEGRTYGMSSPCPCDDCYHHDTCRERHLTCKVSRYWEQNGKPLMYWGTDNAVPRVPDEDI